MLQQVAYGSCFLMPIVQGARMRDNFKASIDAGIGFHIEIGKVLHHIAGFSNGLSHFNFQLKTEVELVCGAVVFCLKEVVDRFVAVVMNPIICVFSFAIIAIPAAHLVMVHQMPATIAVRVIVVPAGQADMVIPAFDKIAVFIRGEVAAVMTTRIMPLEAVRANGFFLALKPACIFCRNSVAAIGTHFVVFVKAVRAKRITVRIGTCFVGIKPIMTVAALFIAKQGRAFTAADNIPTGQVNTISGYWFAAMLAVTKNIRNKGHGFSTDVQDLRHENFLF